MKYLFPFLAACMVGAAQAQEPDSLLMQRASFNNLKQQVHLPDLNTSPGYLKPNKVIVPITMVVYGIVGLESSKLQKLNIETRDEIREHNNQFRTKVDDYLLFVPAASVYALNAAGVKGKHNFKDRTILLAMSTALMAGAVFTLKKFTNQQRPDATTYNSFPSGHTANAFVGAEFLMQEYKHRSPWIGYAGYAVASGTGALRMYNNRHWLSDVITGAGLGILSTKASYWLFDKMKRKRK